MRGGSPKIALGTAQFGLAYGQTLSAPVSPGDVYNILAFAWDHGIDALDTAAAYGSAEKVIGEQAPAGTLFQITTKISRVGAGAVGVAEVEAARNSLQRSLEHLRVSHLETVLFHYTGDLLASGGSALFKAISLFKDEGVVKRIGVSVYDPEELEQILNEYPIDVVQLPLNLLDQRFLIGGYLESLSKKNIKIQIRSVFLQGILLADAKNLNPRFKGLERQLAMLDADAASFELPREAILLRIAASNPHISSIVIGVDGVGHLQRNLGAFETAVSERNFPEFSRYAVADPELIDPRRWRS